MSGKPQRRGRGRGGGGGNFTVPFHQRGSSASDSPGGSGAYRGGGETPGVGEAAGNASQKSPIPDTQVENIENNTVREMKNANTGDVKPQRPGYGVGGRPVLLYANYFALTTPEDLVLYHYSLGWKDGDGNVPVGKKAKRVIDLLLEDHFSSEGYGITSDTTSIIISCKKLELNDGNFTVRYRSEHDEATAARPNYLTSTKADPVLGSKDEIIQALNIMLNHPLKVDSSIATIGANRHFSTNANTQNRKPLGAGLEVIRGFFQSVRAATGRLLVNVQVKNMAFYKEGPLDSLMDAYASENRINKVALERFLKKLTIEVTHRRNSKGQRIPQFKKIQGFARMDDGKKQPHPPIVPHFGAGAEDVQFYLANSSDGGKKEKTDIKTRPTPPSTGRYISVYDFFKQTYGISIKNPKIPVINVKSKDDPVYLPAEVCEVRPGQPARTKLSGAQTNQMISFAVRRPTENMLSISQSGRQLLGFDPMNSTLNAFGLSVSPKLLTVPSRVLMAPGVKYSKHTVPPNFGQWNMRDVKFDVQASLPSWTYLRISVQNGRSPWRDNTQFVTKVKELQDQLGKGGIAVKNYAAGKHIVVNPEQYESQILQGVNDLLKQRPKLILVIIPETDTTQISTRIYNRIKYVCDVLTGVLNVCVLDGKFSQAKVQYLANVSLKFNLKLGGRNHSLDSSKLGLISKGETMVVGIDVTHPSPGSSSKAPSVAAIVASVDQWLGQWPAAIRVQHARQEMVQDLKGLLASRLRLWRQKNGSFPKNILVYRDGVSEGQYNVVLDNELPALREACQELYKPSDTTAGLPKITIVIVGKRHNARFYPTEPRDGDKGGNPVHGTVVDRQVTEARNWDFFLQSHTAIQGTARPAHYYVIYDQIFRKMQCLPGTTAADTLEELTHNMCYLFGRATKAVSICPPAYYADLVCTRARCYMSELFDPSPGAVSDTASVGSESSTVQLPDASLVTIKENIKDTMFYV
ncbi:RNA interference and gene silencing protein [Xylariaceae sp. FL1272]|nr:RNA interference and gene silencing protein [Xylariaceae sp. FL1272]